MGKKETKRVLASVTKTLTNVTALLNNHGERIRALEGAKPMRWETSGEARARLGGESHLTPVIHLQPGDVCTGYEAEDRIVERVYWVMKVEFEGGKTAHHPTDHKIYVADRRRP